MIFQPPIRIQTSSLLAAILMMGMFAGCTGGGQTFEAQIEFFEANPTAVEPGFDVELSWSALDVDQCAVEPELGAVEPQDALIVNPLETTTYVLTCGSATAEVLVTVLPPTAIDTFEANPPAFGVGESVTLSWTTTTATSCTIDQGVGTVEPQGSVEVIPTQTTTYTLACDGLNTSASQSLEVVLGYPVEIGAYTVMPTHIIRGESAVLSWVSTESQSCSIEPGVGEVEVAGQVSVSPEEPTTYTLTCTGLIDTETAIVDLQVDAPAPRILSFGVVETAIAPGENAEIFWTTENSTGCSIDQGVGTVELNGNMFVSPSQTTAYQLTCTGEEGDDASSVVTVTVAPNVEIATFTATPEAIELGSMSTLAWSTTNADSCEISPDIGPVDTTGVQQVQPVSTITYLLECVGPASNATQSLELLVVDPVEITTFTVSEETVELGDSITITWAAQNADSCTIEPEIGAVAASGVLTDVAPAETTTYVLTCSGPVAQAVEEKAVEVLPAMDISSFTLGADTIENGDSAVLSWAVSNADQCEIQPAVGVVDLTGETNVSPTVTQTYTIECTSEIRTKTAEVTLNVVEPLALLSFQASSNFFETPADTIVLQSGDNLYLNWESENATSCILNGGFGTVNTTDQQTANPTESIVYVLECENAVRSVTLEVDVTVVPKLEITTFVAQPYAIEPDNETTLSWEVVGAETCFLEGPGLHSDADGGTMVTETDAGTSLMEVDFVGTMPLTLSESSWYSISCVGPAGEEDLSEQVIVVDPVEILFFDADPSVGINHEDDPTTYPDSLNGASIEDNDYVLLSWDSRNATFGCELNQNIGAVGQSAISIPEEVSPNEDTTYILTCSNAAGSRSVDLEVLVYPPIQIPVFTASPLTVDAREATTLTWSTVNATSCELDNGLGPQPTSGSLAIELLESTTITLSCLGPVRVTEKEVVIYVLPPSGPAVVSTILTNPVEATVSESVDVFWSLDGALETSLTFYPTEEDVMGLTQKSFVPFAEPSLFHSETLVGLAMTNAESSTAYLNTPFGATVGTGTNAQYMVAAGTTLADELVTAVQFENNITFAAGTADEVSFQNTFLASAVSKFNPAGAFEWAVPMTSTSPVEITDIGVLSTGEVVFAGRFAGDMSVGDGPSQVALSSSPETAFWGVLSSSGEVVWADKTQTEGSALINQLDVSVNDNIVLVGQMKTSATFLGGTPSETRIETGAVDNVSNYNDGFLVSFTADGELNWARGIEMQGNSYLADVSAMADGSYVLTGTFNELAGEVDVGNGHLVESAGGNDILLMRVDAQGETVWAKAIGSTQADYGQYVAKGSNDTFFLAGQFDDLTNWGDGYVEYRLNAFGLPDSGGKNGMVGQFSIDGDIIWARGMGGVYTDRILGLTVTPNGDAVLAGVFSSTAFFQPANFWEDPDLPGFDEIYQLINVPRPLNSGGALACTDCHVAGHGSGLDLNDVPDAVYNNLLAAGENRIILGASWADSLFLRKPMLDGVSHGGGERVFIGDDFYNAVTNWLEQGAPRYAPKAEDPPQTEFTDYTLSGIGGNDIFVAAYGNATGQLQWLTQAASGGDDGPENIITGAQGHLPGAAIAANAVGDVWAGVTYQDDLSIGTIEAGGITEVGDPAVERDVALGYLVIPNRRFVRVSYRPVSFTDDVVGALQESSCFECHDSAGAAPDFSALAVDLHAELTAGGAYVAAGDPENSLLLNAPLSDATHSPDAGPAVLIEGEPLEVLLNQWILEGAQYN